MTREYERYPGEEDLWHFSKVNFSKIAENMGCFSARVTEPKKIRESLEEALESGRPALVEVISDIKAIAPSPWWR